MGNVNEWKYIRVPTKKKKKKRKKEKKDPRKYIRVGWSNPV
jgi:hypothetical protein